MFRGFGVEVEEVLKWFKSQDFGQGSSKNRSISSISKPSAVDSTQFKELQTKFRGIALKHSVE